MLGLMDQIETTFALALHYAILSNNVIKRSARWVVQFFSFWLPWYKNLPIPA